MAGPIVLRLRATEKMVGATGFEPATSWSQTKCSSQAELRSDKLASNMSQRKVSASKTASEMKKLISLLSPFDISSGLGKSLVLGLLQNNAAEPVGKRA